VQGGNIKVTVLFTVAPSEVLVSLYENTRRHISKDSIITHYTGVVSYYAVGWLDGGTPVRQKHADFVKLGVLCTLSMVPETTPLYDVLRQHSRVAPRHFEQQFLQPR
jgi:hypothetical protein